MAKYKGKNASSKSDTRDDKWANNSKKPFKGGPHRNNNNRSRGPAMDTQTYGSDRSPNGSRPRAATSSLNDISWYSRNPELLAAAAKIPFPYKPGMIINPGSLTTPASRPASLSLDVPGVCTLYYYYSVGRSSDVGSPVSIAAKELYGKVRSKFSGSLDADAPDLMMFCMAVDMMHSYIAYLKRIYRCIAQYSSENRMYPEGILGAMGFSFAQIDLLQQGRIRLLSHINTLVHKVNKFTVPDDMDVYDRHRWMNENVYTDEPMAASQSFIFVPLGFYIIDDTQPTGTQLNFVATPNMTDVDDFLTYGDAMINALSDWDDAYTIDGYLKRAFEDTPFYTAELINPDEGISPCYVPEVLAQIENFTGVGAVNTGTLTIYQDPTSNAILHLPEANGRVYEGDNIINLHVTSPTAADVTVSSRLMAYVDSSLDIYCGTEIPVACSYCRKTATGWSSATAMPYVSIYDVSNVTQAYFDATFDALFFRSAFNHAPMGWILAYTATGERTWFLGDVCNMTVLSKAQLDEITRVCIYSEFNCFR